MMHGNFLRRFGSMHLNKIVYLSKLIIKIKVTHKIIATPKPPSFTSLFFGVVNEPRSLVV